MSPKRILMVGCGKIGLRVAKLLSTNNEVWGLSRGHQEAEKQNIQFITADVCEPESLNSQLPKNIDYLIYCLTPAERSESAYRQVYLTGLKNTLSALVNNQSLKRLYFVSSTAVYHQDASEVVNESSSTHPNSFSGQVLLEAEALCAASPHPSTVIRFSGIYGAQRNRLIQQVKSGQAQLSTTCRLTNRIHEDDCVGFIHHLVQEDILGNTVEPLYLSSDSKPVDLNEVIGFLASELSVSLEGQLEGKHDTRRAGNKKCNNQKMLESGYQLRFPSYQEGYLEMLKKQ